MEASWVWPVVVLVFLIVLSAFFSGSETALIGSGRVKLALMAEKKKRGARRALSLVEKPGELLAWMGPAIGLALGVFDIFGSTQPTTVMVKTSNGWRI